MLERILDTVSDYSHKHWDSEKSLLEENCISNELLTKEVCQVRCRKIYFPFYEKKLHLQTTIKVTKDTFTSLLHPSSTNQASISWVPNLGLAESPYLIGRKLAKDRNRWREVPVESRAIWSCQPPKKTTLSSSSVRPWAWTQAENGKQPVLPMSILL